MTGCTSWFRPDCLGKREFPSVDDSGRRASASFVVETAHPVHLHERFAEQEFAGGAVEDIEDAVAIGPHHDFARLALPVDVGQHRDLCGVVVEFIVRRELVMPLQLSRVGIQRDDGAGIEIVAWPRISVPVGPGVPGAPVNEIEFGS